MADLALRCATSQCVNRTAAGCAASLRIVPICFLLLSIAACGSTTCPSQGKKQGVAPLLPWCPSFRSRSGRATWCMEVAKDDAPRRTTWGGGGGGGKKLSPGYPWLLGTVSRVLEFQDPCGISRLLGDVSSVWSHTVLLTNIIQGTVLRNLKKS